ncbi:MAG TPA: hypothetical protein VH440_08085, partial [Candidatus Limnocylindrales bacterium]
AGAARDQLERLDDTFRLANIADTQARIALARGDLATAEHAASDAARLAESVSNTKGAVDALLTVARAARRQGRTADAVAALGRAESLAAGAPPARLRQVLTEWSEIAAEAGDHAAAYELTRRALALG